MPDAGSPKRPAARPDWMKDLPDDEKRLAERLMAGDREALAWLLVRYRPGLERYAGTKLAMIKQVVNPSDIVQSVYPDAEQDLGRYLDSGMSVPPYVWFRGLMKSKMSGKRRYHIDASKRSLRRRETLTEDVAQSIADDGPSPSRIVATREELALAREQIARLSPDDREVLELSEAGHTHAEIAEKLGIKENAAAQRVSRARKRLRMIAEGSSPGPLGEVARGQGTSKASGDRPG